MARQRAGQFDRAAESAALFGTNPQGEALDALVLLFEAMTQHARGHPEAARATLATARAELETPLPGPRTGEVSNAWLVDLQARVVLAEAETLIDGKR
jgi:hypothetical protein